MSGAVWTRDLTAGEVITHDDMVVVPGSSGLQWRGGDGYVLGASDMVGMRVWGFGRFLPRAGQPVNLAQAEIKDILGALSERNG